jgi:hypothetical protein
MDLDFRYFGVGLVVQPQKDNMDCSVSYIFLVIWHGIRRCKILEVD